MAAESQVGARLFLIGKDATLAGLKEVQASVARLNKTIAEGAASSKAAAAGTDEQIAAQERLTAVQDLYKKNLAQVNAEQDALAAVGKRAFIGLAAAAAVWGYESIKWAQSFQTALTQLRTQAGLTVGAMNAIGSAAKKNAAGLGVSPTAYLQAAYHPASAGMGVKNSIAITNAAAMLAGIGSAPLEDTTNALTGVMKSYGFGGSHAKRTASLLNAIVGSGNMHYADLNAALSSGVAATSRLYGVSLQSMGGALAYLTDRGIPAAQAGTHLRMTEALIGGPSAQSTKILTAAGLSSSQIASSQSSMAAMLQQAGVTTTQLSQALRNNSGGGGIYNALKLLHQHLTAGGLSPAMQAAVIGRAFGGGRMGSTVMELYQGIGQLGQKTQQIDKNGSVSKLMQDWATYTKTFEFQLHRLGATVQTLGTQFGTALLPVLTEALKLFTDVLGFVGKNKALAIGLGTAITAVLVPAMGVYLKRALLDTNGAIMTVVRGYGRLISGQTVEQASLARTDAALSTEDGALLTNDAALKTNAADARGTGVGRYVGGAGGSAAAPLAGGVALALGLSQLHKNPKAYMAHKAGFSDLMHPSQWLTDIQHNGPFNATNILDPKHYGPIQNITDIWGALHSKNTPAHRSVAQELHFGTIGSAAKHAWDDLFGGGPTNTAKGITIQNHVTVAIDGKQVKDAVVKQTKAVAART